MGVQLSLVAEDFTNVDKGVERRIAERLWRPLGTSNEGSDVPDIFVCQRFGEVLLLQWGTGGSFLLTESAHLDDLVNTTPTFPSGLAATATAALSPSVSATASATPTRRGSVVGFAKELRTVSLAPPARRVVGAPPANMTLGLVTALWMTTQRASLLPRRQADLQPVPLWCRRSGDWTPPDDMGVSSSLGVLTAVRFIAARPPVADIAGLQPSRRGSMDVDRLAIAAPQATLPPGMWTCVAGGSSMVTVAIARVRLSKPNTRLGHTDDHSSPPPRRHGMDYTVDVSVSRIRFLPDSNPVDIIEIVHRCDADAATHANDLAHWSLMADDDDDGDGPAFHHPYTESRQVLAVAGDRTGTLHIIALPSAADATHWQASTDAADEDAPRPWAPAATCVARVPIFHPSSCLYTPRLVGVVLHPLKQLLFALSATHLTVFDLRETFASAFPKGWRQRQAKDPTAGMTTLSALANLRATTDVKSAVEREADLDRPGPARSVGGAALPPSPRSRVGGHDDQSDVATRGRRDPEGQRMQLLALKTLDDMQRSMPAAPRMLHQQPLPCPVASPVRWTHPRAAALVTSRPGGLPTASPTLWHLCEAGGYLLYAGEDGSLHRLSLYGSAMSAVSLAAAARLSFASFCLPEPGAIEPNNHTALPAIPPELAAFAAAAAHKLDAPGPSRQDDHPGDCRLTLSILRYAAALPVRPRRDPLADNVGTKPPLAPSPAPAASSEPPPSWTGPRLLGASLAVVVDSASYRATQVEDDVPDDLNLALELQLLRMVNAAAGRRGLQARSMKSASKVVRTLIGAGRGMQKAALGWPPRPHPSMTSTQPMTPSTGLVDCDAPPSLEPMRRRRAPRPSITRLDVHDTAAPLSLGDASTAARQKDLEGPSWDTPSHQPIDRSRDHHVRTEPLRSGRRILTSQPTTCTNVADSLDALTGDYGNDFEEFEAAMGLKNPGSPSQSVLIPSTASPAAEDRTVASTPFPTDAEHSSFSTVEFREPCPRDRLDLMTTQKIQRLLVLKQYRKLEHVELSTLTTTRERRELLSSPSLQGAMRRAVHSRNERLEAQYGQAAILGEHWKSLVVAGAQRPKSAAPMITSVVSPSVGSETDSAAVASPSPLPDPSVTGHPGPASLRPPTPMVQRDQASAAWVMPRDASISRRIRHRLKASTTNESVRRLLTTGSVPPW